MAENGVRQVARAMLATGVLVGLLGLPGEGKAELQMFDLCSMSEVKGQNALHCDVEQLPYKEGGKSRSGYAITLNTGMKCHEDECTEGRIYYFYTDDKRLIKLSAAPYGNRIEASSCIKSRLQMDSSPGNNGVSVDFNLLATQTLSLENESLRQVYTAKPPFKGEVVSLGGWQCSGDFGYQDGVVSWPEAKSACTAAFSADTKEDLESTDSTLRISGQVGQDIAGYHYICEVQFHGRRNFYRLDLSKDAGVVPALLKKEEYGSFLGKEIKLKPRN
jgi:hypothetical protein